MPRARRPKNDPHFVWQEGDLTFTLPQQPTTVISDELHTILWSLEHAPNKLSLEAAMIPVLAYLAETPSDQNIIGEAIRRAQERLEHAT